MNREYLQWESENLGRKMEALWFGHSGHPVLMFPTSMGRFYQNEDFGLIGALSGKIESGVVQVFCVDSVDEESWYDKQAHPADRIRRHDLYDRYIRHEAIPYVQQRAGQHNISVFGASFGAYHAANIAGRYPDVVSAAVLFSGIYDIHRFVEGYWDDLCYFHCPAAYIANMNPTWSARLSKVCWVIATGEFDSLIQDNRGFADLLASKGIQRHAEFWPGVFGHDWPFWRENISRFLP
jgi:esterase/lipase superfamily enzyme